MFWFCQPAAKTEGIVCSAVYPATEPSLLFRSTFTITEVSSFQETLLAEFGRNFFYLFIFNFIEL